MKKILFIFIVLFISCSSEKDDLEIIDTMIHNTDSYFYTDLDVYKNKDSGLPIGIFDSGTGGLTVFDAIVNYDKYNNSNHSYLTKGDSIKDFNSEKFIYLADQANMPYGNYGKHNKSLLLKEHVLKDAQFLLNNKYYTSSNDQKYKTDKSPIKALVIACNTATAFAKSDIERFIEKANLDIKVIGVIGAGVRAALDSLDLNRNIGIGIMATGGTVSSMGYVNEIKKQTTSNKITVFQQAGIGLAGAIDGAYEFIDLSAESPRESYKGPSDLNRELEIDMENIKRYRFNWKENNMLFSGTIEDPKNIQINSVENYISYHLTTLVEKLRLSNTQTVLEKIILGCTHYPFYTEIFHQKIEDLRNHNENGEFIYQHLINEKIEFIDPAIFTAKELYDYLASEKLFNNDKIENSEFFISVPNRANSNNILEKNGGFTYDYKYGREVNEIQEYVIRVPFSRRNISPNVIERLKTKIPYTYSLISNFNFSNTKTEFLENEEKL